MADIGLSIVEGVASGYTPYRSPSKRNIGLIGRFKRGKANTPVKVTTIEEFTALFGSYSDEFDGPQFGRTVFTEAGDTPVTMYVVRLVNDKFATATGTITTTEGTLTVKAGCQGVEDPGAWGNSVKVTLYGKDTFIKDYYSVTIAYGGYNERHDATSMKELVEAVNQYSNFVVMSFTKGSDSEGGAGQQTVTPGSDTVADQTLKAISPRVSSKTASTNVRVVSSGGDVRITDDAASSSKSCTLSGGTDGAVTKSDLMGNDKCPGWHCFDGCDVQIIAHTDFHEADVEESFNNYLKETANPVGVVNLPLNASASVAQTYAGKLHTDKTSFIAVYLGWCDVLNTEGGKVKIPAIAAVLGAGYIRAPYINGDYVHIPPAGVDSAFNSVISMTPDRLSQADINDYVQKQSCNVVRYVNGVGYYVGTSRAMSSNALYQSIHVRMQTSYYLRCLDQKLRFAEQKPNTPELKAEILVALHTFFKEEYDNGALERSVGFETAYKGICDKTNNPATQDRKLLNVDVMWVPTECTESVRVNLLRNDGILTTTETE